MDQRETEEIAAGAVQSIYSKVAEHCHVFADEIEKSGVEMSGPEALRKFGDIIRNAGQR